MGQSLSNVLVHFVFATKGRTPWLKDAWRHDFHAYLGAILKKRDSSPIIINSVDDHVHMFLPLPRTSSMSDLMKDVKAGSSGWIHRKHPDARGFEWQNGYGAFSVSPGHRDKYQKPTRTPPTRDVSGGVCETFNAVSGEI